MHPVRVRYFAVRYVRLVYFNRKLYEVIETAEQS